MLVDTGASASALYSHASLLGKPIQLVSVQQVDKLVQRKLFQIDGMKIGCLTIENCSCFYKPEGDDYLVDGFVGSGVFKDAVLQVDYANRSLFVLKSYVTDSSEDQIRLKIVQQVPVADFDLDGRVPMIVDTGNNYGLTLQSAIVDRLVKSKSAVRLPQVDRIIQKPARSMFILRELRVGDVKLSDVWGAEGAVNTIGNQVLSRFRVTIDYPNKKLYLKPRTDLPPRDPLFGGGVFFKRNEQGTFVRDLEIDRPTHQAGLQIDDRIIKVDGKSVEKMPFPELYDLLARHDVTVVIEFERDQKPQSVEVRLQQPLAWPPVWPEKKPLRKIPDE